MPAIKKNSFKIHLKPPKKPPQPLLIVTRSEFYLLYLFTVKNAI